jgi:predicted nucleic acid-binding protein
VARGIQTVTSYVADTHALFWYLTNSPRLGSDASNAFDEAANGQSTIYISAIVVAELYYLNKKLTSGFDFAKEMAVLFQASQFVFVPFAANDVLDFEKDSAVTEIHDRIIVGVARRLGAALLTRDNDIVNSNVVATCGS